MPTCACPLRVPMYVCMLVCQAKEKKGRLFSLLLALILFHFTTAAAAVVCVCVVASIVRQSAGSPSLTGAHRVDTQCLLLRVPLDLYLFNICVCVCVSVF